ncbi:hypothetical protein [Vibrio coralliilyticus]|uniref:hypothetical protein n=1 Tax=Vibrio coralliilyticus TaxID=190893 RepID=UPI002FD77BB6
MSLNISGTFDRTISDARIEHVKQANTKEEATYMGLWDKIKDWFCGTDKAQALAHLYEITHEIDTETSESASKKMEAFCKLNQLAGSGFTNRFQGEVIDNHDGTYSFEFEITDVLEKTRVNYGEVSKEADCILGRELTNHSQYLLEDNVSRNGLQDALDRVSFNDENDTYQGVTSSKQNQLATELLSPPAKSQMSRDSQLAQQWVAVQMKCVDHFSDQRARLEQLEGAGNGTPREWVQRGLASLNQIHTSVNKYFAGQQEPVEPMSLSRTSIKEVGLKSKPLPPTQVERLLPTLTLPPRNDEAWNMGRDEDGEKRYRDIGLIVHLLESLKNYQNTHCEYQAEPNFQYKAESGGVRSDFHRAGDIAREQFFNAAITAGYNLNNQEIYRQVDHIAGMYHSLNYESLLTTTGTLLS